MRKSRKKAKLLLLLALLLTISIGYALISTTLKINGTANVLKQTWNVYWDNVVVTDGSVVAEEPVIGANEGIEKTKVTWTVDFDLPGDYYEFTVDAVNAGTIDTMVTNIIDTPPADLPNYIKYTIAYDDGTEIKINDLLPKAINGVPSKDTYKIRILYDPDTATGDTINNIPEDGLSYTFSYSVTYGQATKSAKYRKGIESCPNCVFDFYTNGKTFSGGSSSITGSVLNNYTYDYTSLKDADGKQRLYFLGHELDSNGRIERGYACGILNYGKDNEKVFCLKGGTIEEEASSVIANNSYVLYKTYNSCTQFSGEKHCYGSVNAHYIGINSIGVGTDKFCNLSSSGFMYCSE